jgi:ribosomal protein L11 methyltransferase
VLNTQENALLNALENDSRLVLDCGVAELLKERYNSLNDIILANINRNVLLSDMATYDTVLACGGKIVFSGFFTGDVGLMSKSISDRKWSIDEVLERDGWACIICGKP